MNRDSTAAPSWLPVVCLLAGVMPIVVVNAAWWWNVQHGLAYCNPYWDGCVSISRGVRSGPGLLWFKLAAFPLALLMALTWLKWPRPPASRGLAAVGTLGAVFFLVYALALGTDGEGYRWMRRYGVVFYFGLTGLGQLWLTRQLGKARRDCPDLVDGAGLTILRGVIGATWLLGITSAFKRRLIDDAALIDRVENALEWGFALGLSAVFIAMAGVLRRQTTRVP